MIFEFTEITLSTTGLGCINAVIYSFSVNIRYMHENESPRLQETFLVFLYGELYVDFEEGSTSHLRLQIAVSWNRSNVLQVL